VHPHLLTHILRRWRKHYQPLTCLSSRMAASSYMLAAWSVGWGVHILLTSVGANQGQQVASCPRLCPATDLQRVLQSKACVCVQGWQGVQTIPRVVTFDPVIYEMTFYPVQEVEQLRMGNVSNTTTVSALNATVSWCCCMVAKCMPGVSIVRCKYVCVPCGRVHMQGCACALSSNLCLSCTSLFAACILRGVQRGVLASRLSAGRATAAIFKQRKLYSVVQLDMYCSFAGRGLPSSQLFTAQHEQPPA
jgi:hypothetical protein